MRVIFRQQVEHQRKQIVKPPSNDEPLVWVIMDYLGTHFLKVYGNYIKKGEYCRRGMR